MYLPNVVIVEGKPGKGKTLTAVYLALYHQALYGVKIHSTVELYSVADCICGGQHPIEKGGFWCPKEEAAYPESEAEDIQVLDYRHLPNFTTLYDAMKEAEQTPEAFSDASFILDEGQKFLDSRTSTSKINRIMNQMVGDFRKQRLDIYVTTHHRTMIDKRFRRYVTHLLDPQVYEEEDLCVVSSHEVGTGKAMRFEFQISTVAPFYRTEEKVVTGGKYTKMKESDLE